MSVKYCGQCKYYDARDRYCTKRHETISFGDYSDFATFCNMFSLPEPKFEESKKHIYDSNFVHDAETVPVVTEQAEPERDAVNHPEHYTSGGIECIDCIKAALGSAFIGFLMGNVIKYSYRYKDKNGIEDLKKARWYLDRAIKELTENDER